jgi:HPt (histidine-containing phosphotransfer) domain-containing protein
MFITRGRTEIEALAGAVAQQDAALIQRRAHGIKGAAANIGATDMAALCAEIETTARNRRIDGAEELLGRLRVEFDQVWDTLESLLDMPAVPEK